MASRVPAPAPRFRVGLDGVDAEKAVAKVAMGIGSIHGTCLALEPDDPTEREQDSIAQIEELLHPVGARLMCMSLLAAMGK